MKKVLGVVVAVVFIAGMVTLGWGKEWLVGKKKEPLTPLVTAQPVYDKFKNYVVTLETGLEKRSVKDAIANTDLGLVFTRRSVFYFQDLGEDHFEIHPTELRHAYLVHGGYLVPVYHSGKRAYGYAFFDEKFYGDFVKNCTKGGDVALIIATVETKNRTLSINAAVLKHDYVFNKLYLGDFGRSFFESTGIYVPGKRNGYHQ